MKFRLLIHVLLLILFCSCSNEKISKQLSALEPDTFFRLDTMGVKNWDTLYIVKPYCRLDPQEELQISNKVKREIEGIGRGEIYCILIFTKDRKMIHAESIERYTVADFVYLEKDKYPSDQIYKLDKNRHVLIE